MRSVPLALIACLVRLMMPLAAQDRMEAMPRPIARDVMGEAVRLAALQGGTGRDIRASTVRPEEAKAISGSIHHRGNVSGHRRARSQLVLPVTDNYFCRRRVSKRSAAGDRSGTR